MVELKELRSKGQAMEPTIRIGKNGLNEGAIKEIDKLLKKKKLIKVKFLKSCLDGNDKKKVFEELIQKTGAIMVTKVGFVALIYRQSAKIK